MPHTADLPPPHSPNGKDVIMPASRADWRSWLDAHPDRSEGIWVVFRKPTSALEGPSYNDMVEEALCFGWIDSLVRRVDDDRTIQWYSPRRKGGVWARSNKDRIVRLVAQGVMTERGLAIIDAAKSDGSWSQYDDVEAMVVHSDLAAALASEPAARDAYESKSDSHKKQDLWWIYSAKRPETRVNRIIHLTRRLTEGE
ncbi:MAG: YdeI/OmpD-associated family protein [Acidimicrobiia bacterium]